LPNNPSLLNNYRLLGLCDLQGSVTHRMRAGRVARKVHASWRTQSTSRAPCSARSLNLRLVARTVRTIRSLHALCTRRVAKKLSYASDAVLLSRVGRARARRVKSKRGIENARLS